MNKTSHTEDGVIYSGETVTVRCAIQGGEGAQWTYEWSPAKLNTSPTSNEYTISSVSESDGGGYSCRGTRGSSWTEWSDVITLNVKYSPRPSDISGLVQFQECGCRGNGTAKPEPEV
uniref:Ig-like domain-containing protein n=1 Tax=Pundamilia nyererei TaxID=303518 RepID=A0A3B4GVS1_9CICH